MAPSSQDIDGETETVATTIGLYALGELTLGQAANRLDISRERMKHVLIDAGVGLRIGSPTKADAIEEVRALNERQ